MARRSSRKKRSLFSRLIRFTLIFFALFFGVLAAVPYFFKDEIVEIVKKSANENLNAEVDFGDFDLSLIRNFPNFSFAIKDLTVKGKEEFEGVALADIGKLELVLDVMKAINGNYSIIRLGITEPEIHAMVLDGGKANWDITFPDTTAVEEEVVEDTAAAEFAMDLHEYFIKDAKIIYDDQDGDMYMELKNFSHKGEGNFALDTFTLYTQTNIESIDFIMDGMSYVRKTKLDFKADINSDLENMKFTFMDNLLKINELPLAFNGYVAMPSDDIEMDMSFDVKESSFRSILSMVPSVYMRDFKDIETKGDFALSGFARGIYNDDNIPAFDLNLNINEAWFHYPDLPAAVEEIYMDLNIACKDGSDIDNVTVNMPNFHLKMADNPVDMAFSLAHPISDPLIGASLKMLIDLEKMKQVVPMVEGEEYNGIIKSDMSMKGRYSSIEKEQYDQFEADGSLSIYKMIYKSPDLDHDVYIDSMTFLFSPQNLKLDQFYSRIDGSDFWAKGQIDNYLAYALKDETLKGRFDIGSEYLDLDALSAPYMVEDTEAKEAAPADTAETPMEVFEVPENMDVLLNTHFKKVHFYGVDMEDINGDIVVHEQVAKLDDLDMRVLGGDVEINGSYDTKDPQKPHVDFDYDVKDLDIESSVATFNTIATLAPIAKYCQGKVSTLMNLNMDLGEDMMPIYSSIFGNGELTADDVMMQGFKAVEILEEELKFKGISGKEIKDIDLYFDIKDGKVTTKPFTVKVGDMETEIGGWTNFDMQMDYKLIMNVPSEVLGGDASEAVGELAGELGKAGEKVELGETIPVTATLKGAIDNPKVGIDFKGMGKKAVEDAKEIAKEVVKEEIEEVKKDVKAEADKILKDAQAAADKIMAEATKAGDQVLAEAETLAADTKKQGYAEADQLVKDAGGNFIEKKAAEVAANKLRESSDKTANGIVNKGKTERGKIIGAAQQKSDKIMSDAQAKVDSL